MSIFARVLDHPRFHFAAKAYPKDELEVISFSGTEAISELFRFEIDLCAKTPDIDFDAVVNKEACLIVVGRRRKSYVHGIVTRFELLQSLPERTIYRAVLEPPQARLALRRKLRIFQQKTTQQIVTQVLKENGITDVSFKLNASYQPRDFCVQYRETDLDFISRLLEEEGIACHFQQSKGGVKTVYSDNVGAFPSIPDEADVIYNEDVSRVPKQEFVHGLIYGHRLRTGKVLLRDYNFKNPSEEKGEGVGQGKGVDPKLEVYDYPGEFQDAGLAKRLAEVRRDEALMERRSAYGKSDCSRFSAGYTFKLGGKNDAQKHSRADLNQKYLLTRVVHAGDQPDVMREEGGKTEQPAKYGNTFTVIVGGVEFRPQRVTPRPVARGSHTATVVGPDGEEIYVDKFGRVKVRFHWDKESKSDEHSSCWIRVSQNWAGSGYGGMFIPRIGQEVLVGFIEGDPDRPLITGRVYNAEQKVPYPLPSKKTVSTLRSQSSPKKKGNNELRFEDQAGSEEIWVHAEKDYELFVENDRTSWIGRDRKETVDNDQEVKVNNDRGLLVTKKSKHTAQEIRYEASQSIAIKVGQASIELTPLSITIRAPTVLSRARGIHTIKGGPMVLINCAGGGAGGPQGADDQAPSPVDRTKGPKKVKAKVGAGKPPKEKEFKAVQPEKKTTQPPPPAAPATKPDPCAYLDNKPGVFSSPPMAQRSTPKVVKTEDGKYAFPEGRFWTVPLSGEKQDVKITTVDVNGHSVKIIEPKSGGTVTTAQAIQALGKLPPVAAGEVDEVVLSPNANPLDSYWGKKYKTEGFVSAATGGGGTVNYYKSMANHSQGSIDGVMAHEAGHNVYTSLWNPTSGLFWKRAMSKDGRSVSNYADNSYTEDFAESTQMYAATKGTPCEAKARQLYPARYEALDTIMEKKSSKTWW